MMVIGWVMNSALTMLESVALTGMMRMRAVGCKGNLVAAGKPVFSLIGAADSTMYASVGLWVSGSHAD